MAVAKKASPTGIGIGTVIAGPAAPPKVGPGGIVPPVPMGGPGPMGMGGSSLGPPPPMTGGPGPMGGSSLGPPPGGPMGTMPGVQPLPGSDEDPVVMQRKKRERLTIKAHATAWALHYYLARQKPELLEKHYYIAALNPFFHMIEVIRSPMLGEIPSGSSYLALALITVANLAASGWLFSRFRARIAYWV